MLVWLFLIKECLLNTCICFVDFLSCILKNILAHEDLRNAQNSLKESQKTVKELEKSISEKESQILSVEEALGKTIKELQIQVKRYAIIKTSPVNLLLVSSAFLFLKNFLGS